MGFILNSHQHWYTLRRFGNVSPDPSPEADTGNGHWFNLNSFLPKPERVGKLYLGMVLQQAETEGTFPFNFIFRNTLLCIPVSLLSKTLLSYTNIRRSLY